MTFQDPLWLWGLALLPLLLLDYGRRLRRPRPALRYPSLAGLKPLPRGWLLRARHLLFLLRLLALAALCIALARPQRGEALEDITTEGVDILLVLDVSSSMKTMDFRPRNRLFVAKQVLQEFIAARRHDRIGLVVFSGKAFTQCPLTLDYSVLTQLLSRVDFGWVEDGTAIGTAILAASNRLRSGEAKSKVMVLLTDGENNAGEVDPVTAAKAAKALGIRIYAVGVGKEGEQPIEVDDPLFGKRIVTVPTKIDEPMMRRIASLTEGRYYRAQDPEALREIYSTIDRLEKTEIKSNRYMRYEERFMGLALLALGLLFLEILLAQTRFLRIP